jgi:hypothetical protein
MSKRGLHTVNSVSKKRTAEAQPENAHGRFFWKVGNNKSDNDVTKAI